MDHRNLSREPQVTTFHDIMHISYGMNHNRNMIIVFDRWWEAGRTFLEDSLTAALHSKSCRKHQRERRAHDGRTLAVVPITSAIPSSSALLASVCQGARQPWDESRAKGRVRSPWCHQEKRSR
eukprot:746509-Hanusia_phi.AAC.1